MNLQRRYITLVAMLCLALLTSAGSLQGAPARLGERSFVTVMAPPGPAGTELTPCGESNESCPVYLAATTAAGGVCVYCPDLSAFVTYDRTNPRNSIARVSAPPDFDTQAPCDVVLDPEGNIYVATETSDMSAHFIVNVYSVSTDSWSRDTLNADGLSVKRIGSREVPTRGTLRIDYVPALGAVLYSATSSAAPKVLVARSGNVLRGRDRRASSSTGTDAAQISTRIANTQVPARDRPWAPPIPINGRPLGRDAAGNYYTLTIPPGVGTTFNKYDPHGRLVASGAPPMRRTVRRVRGKGPYLMMADGTIEYVQILSIGFVISEVAVVP